VGSRRIGVLSLEREKEARDEAFQREQAVKAEAYQREKEARAMAKDDRSRDHSIPHFLFASSDRFSVRCTV